MTSSSSVRVEAIALPTDWPVGPVNVYLIYGDKLTLVDTGLETERSWRELHDGLNAKGLSLQDIEQIVITHHHTDHAEMLEWIAKEIDVPIYIHPYAKPFLTYDRHYMQWSDEFFEQLYFEFGLPYELAQQQKKRSQHLRNPPDYDLRLVNHGDDIPGLPGWKVIETLGHSQDHISLFHVRTRQFICGDHLIKGMAAGIFMDAPFDTRERAKPMIQYIESLHDCLSLNISQAFSGHGPVITHVPREIDEQLRRIENRATRTLNTLINHGDLTGFEILHLMYPNRYEEAVGLFVSEMVSMLDVLEDRGEVTAEKINGVYTYRLN